MYCIIIKKKKILFLYMLNGYFIRCYGKDMYKFLKNVLQIIRVKYSFTKFFFCKFDNKNN